MAPSRYNGGSQTPQSASAISDNHRHSAPDGVTFRAPVLADAAAIWGLVRDTGVLDLNSPYAYLLVAEHFGATSVVAELDATLIGFISAYCPPTRDDTVFVWQVGVAAVGRGRGVATRMLVEIVKRAACGQLRYLDTTIGPSNEASKALFRGFARRLDAAVEETELFTADQFPEAGHESEILFRIGPFTREAAQCV